MYEVCNEVQHYTTLAFANQHYIRQTRSMIYPASHVVSHHNLQASCLTLTISANKYSMLQKLSLCLPSKFILNAIWAITVMYDFSVTKLLLLRCKIHVHQMGYLL